MRIYHLSNQENQDKIKAKIRNKTENPLRAKLTSTKMLESLTRKKEIVSPHTDILCIIEMRGQEMVNIKCMYKIITIS